MKTNYIFLVLMMVFFISCDENDQPNNCIEGFGPTITESRTVDSFHSIDASIVGNIYITQGATQELSIVTHQNIMDELNTTVTNNTLKIDFDRCINDIDKLDIYITIPDIESIIFAGVGNIESENDWDLDNLSVIFSGVGLSNLSGTVDNFSYILSGVGDLKAFDLSTSNTNINISGNGNAEISVSDNLVVTIAGGGNVSYKGDPALTSNITGTGTVTKVM